MTTGVLAHDGPRRRPPAGRLGAVAGLTPVMMYLAWIAISGWGGDASQFARATAEITLGAVVAGWIVGGRLGRSFAGGVLGLVAYGFVAYLVLLPVNIAGSTWEEVRSGRVSDLLELSRSRRAVMCRTASSPGSTCLCSCSRSGPVGS